MLRVAVLSQGQPAPRWSGVASARDRPSHGQYTCTKRVIAPGRTPTPILDWLHREASAILQQPAIEKGRAVDATGVMTASRDECGKLLAREVAKRREIIRQAGVANR